MSRAGWSWGTGLLLVVALGISFQVTQGPIAALITLAFGYVALIAVKQPKLLFAYTALAVLFSATLSQISGVTAFASLDEALVAICLGVFPMRRLLSGREIRWPPGIVCFSGALVCGVLSSLQHQVPSSVTLAGAVFVVKGVLFGFAAAQEDWTHLDVIRIRNAALALLTFLLACGALNLALPAAWGAVFSSTTDVSFRYGSRSLIGPFTQPGFYAQALALCITAVFVFREHDRTFAGRWFLPLGLAAAILTFRRKTWVSLPVALLVARGVRRPALVVTIMLPALFVAAIVFSGPVTKVATATYQEYFGRSDSAVPRVLMYRGAIDVANRDFPLGAGLGRWGSSPAYSSYSPEYVARGFGSLNVLAPNGNSSFATDTFWPVILGETGYLGLVLYALGLARIGSSLIQVARRNRASLTGAVATVGLSWLAVLLVESVAAPVFLGTPTYVWLFAASAVALVRAELTESTDTSASSDIAR